MSKLKLLDRIQSKQNTTDCGKEATILRTLEEQPEYHLQHQKRVPKLLPGEKV